MLDKASFLKNFQAFEDYEINISKYLYYYLIINKKIVKLQKLNLGNFDHA